MAGICTNSTRKGGANCDHRSLTVALDGANVTDEFTGADLDAVDWDGLLPSDWRMLTLKQLWVRLGIKKKRLAGVTLDNLVGYCTNGDEATNVKIYSFFGPGAAITKTNIGTSYVN